MTTTNRSFSVRKSGDGVEVCWTGEAPDLSGLHTFDRTEWQVGVQESLLRVLKTNDYHEVM